MTVGLSFDPKTFLEYEQSSLGPIQDSLYRYQCTTDEEFWNEHEQFRVPMHPICAYEQIGRQIPSCTTYLKVSPEFGQDPGAIFANFTEDVKLWLEQVEYH
ncbi:MAG: hypothetical protein ACOYK9_05595 [Chlamydiia bacterium]